MVNQHGERRERGNEYATGHVTGAGRPDGERQTHGAQRRAGEQHEAQQRTGQQHESGQQSRWPSSGGERDTASLRRRYANTEQTQYGGSLSDEPGPVEQTRTRENQSRTEGRIEGSHQNRRRYGTPQAEQGRTTRQGHGGSRGQLRSGQERTHGEMQFGGDRGGSEREHRYGSRYGHGSERRG